MHCGKTGVSISEFKKTHFPVFVNLTVKVKFKIDS